MSEESIIILFEVDILKARKVGRTKAVQMGFSEVEIHEIETAITELATNLVKYRTIRGQISVKPVAENGRQGIEVISTDKGPGISDLSFAMEDGNSTSGTLGVGLSGVKRMMDEFFIESSPERGTTILTRKWLKTSSRQKLNFAVVAYPKTGEEVSGDAYFTFQNDEYAFVTVIDALGHGIEAHEVALKVLKVVEHYHFLPLQELLRRCHEFLMHSRGAAVAFCKINFADSQLEHISIGNVETWLCSPSKTRRLVSYNGTIGMAMENKQVNSYSFQKDQALLMFSDGISASFAIPIELLERKPSEIAAYLVSNYRRGYDDETMLVGKFF